MRRHSGDTFKAGVSTSGLEPVFLLGLIGERGCRFPTACIGGGVWGEGSECVCVRTLCVCVGTAGPTA